MWLSLTTLYTALAWELEGHVWAEADRPIQLQVAGIEIEGSAKEAPFETLRDAAEGWGPGLCEGLTDIRIELSEAGENQPFAKDGISSISFGDPGDEFATGVLSATSTQTRGVVVKEVDGLFLYEALESDIVFNDAVHFLTEDDAEESGCVEGHSLQATATHAFGHVLGLAHPCELGEDCLPEHEESTLYPDIAPCDISASTPEGDDIDGMQEIYGSNVLSGDLYCVGGENRDYGFCRGAPPLEITCTAQNTNPLVSTAVWDFKDGESAWGLEATHIYTEVGEYLIDVCLEGPDVDRCDWSIAYCREDVSLCQAFPEADEEASAGCGCGGSEPVASWWLLGLLAARRKSSWRE